MRTHLILVAGLLGLLSWFSSAPAWAQGDAPPNSLPFETTGKLEDVGDDTLRILDSKNDDIWLIKVGHDTVLAIEGDADRTALRPGVVVQFTAKISDKGVLQEEVKELEIVSFQGKASLGGLFVPGDEEDGAKPVRVPKAGSYRIRGCVKSFKDNQLGVVAGRTKVSGKLADEAEVTLHVDDASIAQNGDSVNVKGWYYGNGRPNPMLGRPGSAMGQEVTITLSKPFAPVSKKGRLADKPAKSSARSAKTSK